MGDIDFEQNTVTIKHLKIRTNVSCPKCRVRLSKAAKFCPGCGTSVEKVVAQTQEHYRQRSLPLDKETLEMVRNYVERSKATSCNKKQLLFNISRGQAWRIIATLADEVELGKLVDPDTGRMRNVSPHRLRDAFAVHAVKVDDSGDGLRLLQQHLGHQSISTTMRYRKVAGFEHKEWFGRLWDSRSST